MQFKLLGSVGTFGLITLCLLNTERIFKMITKNHDALMYQKQLDAAGSAKAKELAHH